MSEPRQHHDGDTGDVDYEDVDGQVRTGEHEETEELTPSKVVHVRGLPRGVVEKELNALAVPFGDVVKTLIIQTKGQAFLEMESVDAARKMLTYYSKTEANLKGRRVFFQYSNREEIKLRGGPSRELGSKSDDQDRPNKILLVSILDCRVAITIQDLHQVFCPYGEVDKIVTFVKNNVFKTLIQYRYAEYAINAKLALDGKQMYQGCCVFHILFSRLTDLKVKTNTARARDFTVPPEKFPPHFQTPLASTFPLQPDFRRGGYGTPSKQPIFSGYPPGYTDVPQPDYMGNVKGSVLLVTNLVEQKVTPDVLFTLFGVYGDVQRVKIFYNKQHSALVQLADAYQASLAQLHLNHVDLFGKSLTILPSKHASVSLPHPSLQKSSNLARDYSASPLHRFKFNRSKNFRHICPPGPVLHVSNLAEDATADGLRGLFGTKVTAIQFFKTDRRMAFVRLASTADAVAALVRLHNTKVAGKPIKVSFSPKKPAQIEDDFKSEESSAQSTSESYETHTSPPTKSKTGKPSSPSATTKGRSGTGSSQSSTAVAPRSVSTASTTRQTQSQTRSSTSSVPAPSHTTPQSTSAPRGKPGQSSGPAQGTRPSGQSRVVGSQAPVARAPRSTVSQGYYQQQTKQMHDAYVLPDYYEQQGYREQKR